MSQEGRLESLKSKHATLEHEILEEVSRPHPDDIRLAELKKEKLRVKEQLVGLEDA